MKFDKFVGENLIDQLKVVGCFYDCIDGLLKIIGMVCYVYEWYEEVFNVVYGYIVGFVIVKGCFIVFDMDVV